MSAIVKVYLEAIEKALKAGNATEHTHRPALKALIEQIGDGVTATNEPKRIACGAPDFTVAVENLTLGYIEAKDVGKSLDEAECSDQLKRYRRALDNLILTDYLVFRRYTDGKVVEDVRLATVQSHGRLKAQKGGAESVEALLTNFLKTNPPDINTPKELAERMARLTHMIRDIIVFAFENKQASPLLQGWRDAFTRVLIPELSRDDKTPDFADMFAQTLAYGLFTARIMDPSPKNFTRQEAQYLIPKSNPFLRDFFIQITGPQLDDEPFVSFVNDLVNLLAHTDMAAVLADFGRRTKQEDPVVHFYETFLAAYDPQLRETRGVYFTPEPVVSYIVRSVDYLLRTRFDCPNGLADDSKIVLPNHVDIGKEKREKTKPQDTECHKVLILDPATGTCTFLYAVIDLIRQQFIQKGDAGMWPGYVKNHLLPRLFGFELLVAPYAVAHFKLSLQLAGRDLPDALAKKWAYYPSDDERLGVYLTNTLQEPQELTDLPLFTQWVADETKAANKVKQTLPVLVVMGNPPYSGHTANKGNWIEGLLKGELPTGEKTGNYYEVDGQPLGERNPKWLQDDYVKFIRFGQWRIEQSGGGILAYITNNGYLDNPTFRGMRQSLIQTFTEIFLLDLHGSAKKRETAPDGSKDENVFDIQQGVAIGIFVKQPGKKGPAKVHHAELWGRRTTKYEQLLEQDVAVTNWTEVVPRTPFYLFKLQNGGVLREYNQGWKITDAVPVNVLGFQTHRDHFAIDFDYDVLQSRIREMRDKKLTDDEFQDKYNLKDNRDWQLSRARNNLRKADNWKRFLMKCSYRPFDWRYCYFDEVAMDYPRKELKCHVTARDNLCINTVRQTRLTDWRHAFASNAPAPAVFLEIKDGSSVFPLYLYPTEESSNHNNLHDNSHWPPDEAHGGRVPNLAPQFVSAMEAKLGLSFQPFITGKRTKAKTFSPEDVFHYIYAVLQSPTYRNRYAEFLKIDFPRVPLTSSVRLFWKLCGLGKKLVALHLLEAPEVKQFATQYPVAGNNWVEKGYPKYVPQKGKAPGRVHINSTQYFEGVPKEVWEFYIGGYQVLHKWLKDRRGRQLSYDDLMHYQQVIVALQETIKLMNRIDDTITEWPIE